MNASERLNAALGLAKASSALLNPAMQIARGPGRMIQKLITQRPLIAAGLDNIAAKGYARQLGDLPHPIQQALITKNPSVPGGLQTRTSMARYLRSARNKYETFSGSPHFYPDSQFMEAPLPTGGKMPVRFDGYYGRGMPAVTSFNRRMIPAPMPGRQFNPGSSGIAKNFNWHGLDLPAEGMPGYDDWQSIRARIPKVLA
jgi:hypothetical protein